MRLLLVGVGALFLAMSCSAGGDGSSTNSNTGTGGESSQSGGDGGSAGGVFEGGFNSTGGGGDANICKVPPEGEDAVVPDCDDEALAGSFEPVVQWTWNAPPGGGFYGYEGTFATPIVGNFTDDNADGAIDLCDIPDVIIAANAGSLHMLSGDTGAEILTFDIPIDPLVHPALADIDGDGLNEVLSVDTTGHLVAFEHDGSLKWTGSVGGFSASFSSRVCSTINVYDIEADGTPEILLGFEVFSNTGTLLWGVPGNAAQYDGQFWCVTPTAADLDGDGKLEVLFGHQTYHHNGQLYWELAGSPPAHPHVANLDADLDPEVFLTTMNGITVVEHDGTLKYGPVRPTDPNPGALCWGKPAVVHDFDGNGQANLAAGTCTDYSMYNVGLTGVTVAWTQPVSDFSGLATATAFDFLGDGVAEAIYADETLLYVFDGLSGMQALTSPRSSGTIIEYPIVADIDNDASAEIVYVSNYPGVATGPTVTVLSDAMNRWIPARRIWNQYSYHVTNVREDGTIPQVMKKSWQLLNTFRTNSQIGAEGDCAPEPPN